MQDGAAWLPIREASGALGISPRTVKRRAACGALPSKLENGRRLVAVPSVTGTKGDNRANGPVTEGQSGQGQRDSERESGLIERGTEGHLAQSGPVTEGTNAALLMEQRQLDRAEIAFLRSTIEQHQRSEAELRAALRKALEAMPKALTEGRAREKPPDVVLPVARSDGPQIAPERGKNPTYGDLADWLESQMEGDLRMP